jgi:hypothetical protein
MVYDRVQVLDGMTVEHVWFELPNFFLVSTTLLLPNIHQPKKIDFYESS